MSLKKLKPIDEARCRTLAERMSDPTPVAANRALGPRKSRMGRRPLNWLSSPNNFGRSLGWIPGMGNWTSCLSGWRRGDPTVLWEINMECGRCWCHPAHIYSIPQCHHSDHALTPRRRTWEALGSYFTCDPPSMKVGVSVRCPSLLPFSWVTLFYSLFGN